MPGTCSFFKVLWQCFEETVFYVQFSGEELEVKAEMLSNSVKVTQH